MRTWEHASRASRRLKKEPGLSEYNQFGSRSVFPLCARLLVAAMLFLAPIREATIGPRRTAPIVASASANSNAFEQPGMPWYFRSGQWRADIRSLVAALLYLAQSDAMAQTNLIPTKADNV